MGFSSLHPNSTQTTNEQTVPQVCRVKRTPQESRQQKVRSTSHQRKHQAAKNNLHDSCSIHPDKSNTWKIDQQSPIFNRLRFFDQSCLSRAAEAWHQTPARYASLSAKCLSSEQVKAHWLGRRRRRSPLRCCCAPLRLPFSAPGPRCSSLQS